MHKSRGSKTDDERPENDEDGSPNASAAIVKPQFLSIFTSKSNDKMVNHFASSDPNSILVFPRKFCNLKPNKFWKKQKGKVCMNFIITDSQFYLYLIYVIQKGLL